MKDLHRRTASDKVLSHKAFNIVENPKYNLYQHGLASLAYKFFDKKSEGANTSGGAVTRAHQSAVKCQIMLNQELAEKLHKSIS